MKIIEIYLIAFFETQRFSFQIGKNLINTQGTYSLILRCAIHQILFGNHERGRTLPDQYGAVASGHEYSLPGGIYPFPTTDQRSEVSVQV